MTRFIPFFLLSLLIAACKTTAKTDLGVSVPKPTTEAPRLRVTRAATETEIQAGGDAQVSTSSQRDIPVQQQRANDSAEPMRQSISDEVLREDMRTIGRTERELRQMGITPGMSQEERAAAEARHAERQRPLPANPTVQQVVAKDDIAVYRTTPCAAGDCPVYQLRILNDRTLHYQGIENVELIGHFHGRMTNSEPMSGLLRLYTKNQYYRMDDTYPAELTRKIRKGQAKVTEIEALGKRKSVVNYFGAPKELEEIEKYLFDLMEQADWTELIEE
ncbi:MAG: DUF6438 domain-containing protein [Bacteroidota bacterium]